MSTTAGDQINAALRLLGVLAEGETPSSDTSADALAALNQMLDSWSIERLAVYATGTQTFTWPANTQSLTLGPTGATITGTRPVNIDASTYYNYQNLSYQLEQINQEQYNAIVLKTATSPLPAYLFVNMGMPNIEMSLYPVPGGDITFYLVSDTVLSQASTTSTVLSFPPGYLRAFKYNLACELAPEFGVEPSRTVQRIADVSKRAIKRINNPEDVMVMPSTVLSAPGGFNYYTGEPY